ncbi:FecCD family ABC transporter permease [Anaerovorax odorimutans]|uniref:FecCD family ABC transporter permease n=1 Tax=Anaerovorax odorimutans TaxID=109327 RepID=UPI00042630EF|nr:iron ABC transporter permease [Anaerovorax odorimutans]
MNSKHKEILQTDNSLQERLASRWPVFFIFLVFAFLVSSSIGKYHISIPDIIQTIYYHYADPSQITNTNMETTLFNIRLPRVIAALGIGGGLSIAGASYQGMFKNPMVSPDILGASAGAAFGACVAMLMGLNTYLVQLFGFCTGLIAVTLASNVTKRLGHDPILGLVLGGIMTSTLCSAGTSMVKLIADADDKLPQITFWLMGGFNTINKERIISILLPMAVGFVSLFLSRWQLNVLSFGEDEARSLGIKTTRVRRMIIIASTLITASSVSVCGLVGWVGLVIPHIGRAIVGPNFRYLLPTCAILGAVFLVFVDDVARCAFSVELPIGILTSFIGIPFFYFILRYNRGKDQSDD